MANVVAGFGTHTRFFRFRQARRSRQRNRQAVAAQKEHLAAVRPDVIVMFDTDHLNTFFSTTCRSFAVGVDKNFTGPNDEPRKCRCTRFPPPSIWRRISAKPAWKRVSTWP